MDPRAEKEQCLIPKCPERKQGCVTGHCMEFRGYSHFGVLRASVKTEYGTGCTLFIGNAYKNLINEKTYPNYLQEGGE